MKKLITLLSILMISLVMYLSFVTIKTDNVTIKTDKETQIWNIDSCQFSLPSEKTVIIRLDDVQGNWRVYTVMRLTDASLDRDIPITLAVMPNKNINNDTIMKNYIINKIKDPRVEIAQHGTNHVEHEYQSLNESETYNLARLGLDRMVNTFGIYPITFIPPYNEYNENTTKVLPKLGFRILSAGRDEYKHDENMLYIGNTIQTGYGIGKELTHIDKILYYCNKSLEKRNICVIMSHPQDFVKDDGKTLDETRYNEFVRLLDTLKTWNVKFSTFKELLKCSDN